jgi:hypothetical protein
MIAAGGIGPKGRLVSKEGFDLFSTGHIEAKEFGPTASYGYGIAVDRLDGHRVVRHTGGMLSFMSSIIVDLDEGVGAFASVNAMQGYRPTDVTQFAVQQMRAARAKRPLPPVPPAEIPGEVGNAGDYVGTYRDPSGSTLVIEQEGKRLYWRRGADRMALEPASESDQFIVQHPEFAHFALIFARQDAENPKSPIVEAAWGTEWYAAAAYQGPREFSHPAAWESYVGHYWTENPWVGSLRVVVRKDKLWLDGVIPLEAHGDVFYLRDEKHSPEWVRFGETVNGRCMRLSYSGETLWRVAAA